MRTQEYMCEFKNFISYKWRVSGRYGHGYRYGYEKGHTASIYLFFHP